MSEHPVTHIIWFTPESAAHDERIPPEVLNEIERAWRVGELTAGVDYMLVIVMRGEEIEEVFIYDGGKGA